MQRNVLEEVRDQTVAAMLEMDDGVARYAKGMAPYDADKLTDDEEDFLFDNMAVAYQAEFPGITNDQAHAQYRSDVGDNEYLAMCERVYARGRAGQLYDPVTLMPMMEQPMMMEVPPVVAGP